MINLTNMYSPLSIGISLTSLCLFFFINIDQATNKINEKTPYIPTQKKQTSESSKKAIKVHKKPSPHLILLPAPPLKQNRIIEQKKIPDLNFSRKLIKLKISKLAKSRANKREGKNINQVNSGTIKNVLTPIRKEKIEKKYLKPKQSANKIFYKNLVAQPSKVSGTIKPIRPFETNKKVKSKLYSREETHPLSNDRKTTRDEALRKGRPILKILEHGSEPSINFIWPNNSKDRNFLFKILRKCYGMRTAVIDDRKTIYSSTQIPGSKYKVNLDKTSGFIRLVDGKLSESEMKITNKIKKSHRISYGSTIRLFPRNFDSLLLGKISFLSKGLGTDLRTITGHYKLKGTRVIIENLAINKQKIIGIVDLSPVSDCQNHVQLL